MGYYDSFPTQFLGTTFTTTTTTGKKKKPVIEVNEEVQDTQSSNQSIMDKLLSEYQKSYAEAKASNEARYNQLLSNYDKQKAEAQSLLKTYGQSQKSKIADTYKEQLSNTMQNLVSTGLYNTTAQGAERARSAKGRASSEAELGESINTQKLNILNQIDQARNAAIEGRTDEYPDMSTFLNLMNQYGQYGQSSSTGSTGVNTAPFYSTKNVGSKNRFKDDGSMYDYKNNESGFINTRIKNTRIKDGMTVLKTPSSESMRINPNEYSTQGTYSSSNLNNLINNYNTSIKTPISSGYTPISVLNARNSQNRASSSYISGITGKRMVNNVPITSTPSIGGISYSRTPLYTLSKKSKSSPSKGSRYSSYVSSSSKLSRRA